MAEYYSAELSEKVVRGLTENAYKCKFNGDTLPLGYTIDSEQHFQIDPLVAPAVLEAFKRYAEGASMTEIAQGMNAKGLRSAFGGIIPVFRRTELNAPVFKPRDSAQYTIFIVITPYIILVVPT